MVVTNAVKNYKDGQDGYTQYPRRVSLTTQTSRVPMFNK